MKPKDLIKVVEPFEDIRLNRTAFRERRLDPPVEEWANSDCICHSCFNWLSNDIGCIGPLYGFLGCKGEFYCGYYIYDRSKHEA